MLSLSDMKVASEEFREVRVLSVVLLEPDECVIDHGPLVIQHFLVELQFGLCDFTPNMANSVHLRDDFKVELHQVGIDLK